MGQNPTRTLLPRSQPEPRNLPHGQESLEPDTCNDSWEADDYAMMQGLDGVITTKMLKNKYAYDYSC